jgi:hypothetical protein
MVSGNIIILSLVKVNSLVRYHMFCSHPHNYKIQTGCITLNTAAGIVRHKLKTVESTSTAVEALCCYWREKRPHGGSYFHDITFQLYSDNCHIDIACTNWVYDRLWCSLVEGRNRNSKQTKKLFRPLKFSYVKLFLCTLRRHNSTHS